MSRLVFLHTWHPKERQHWQLKVSRVVQKLDLQINALVICLWGKTAAMLTKYTGGNSEIRTNVKSRCNVALFDEISLESSSLLLENTKNARDKRRRRVFLRREDIVMASLRTSPVSQIVTNGQFHCHSTGVVARSHNFRAGKKVEEFYPRTTSSPASFSLSHIRYQFQFSSLSPQPDDCFDRLTTSTRVTEGREILPSDNRRKLAVYCRSPNSQKASLLLFVGVVRLLTSVTWTCSTFSVRNLFMLQKFQAIGCINLESQCVDRVVY